MAFISVEGEVNRVFYNGLGISVKETFTRRDGEPGASYYTAWFEKDPGLSEGDRGKFSGLFVVRKSEYEKDGEMKVGIDVSINNTRFEPSGDSGGSGDGPF